MRIFIVSDWPDSISAAADRLRRMGYVCCLPRARPTTLEVSIIQACDVLLGVGFTQEPDCAELRAAVSLGIAVSAGLRIILCGYIPPEYKFPHAICFPSFEDAVLNYFEKIASLCYKRQG